MSYFNSLSLKNESMKFTVLLSIGILSPLFVHTAGLSGTSLLPIFFALSIGAAFLHPLSLILLAIVNPLVNFLLTGMPAAAPLPMLYILIGEGLGIALMVLPFRKRFVSFMLSLILALFLVQVFGLMGLKFLGGAVNYYFFIGVIVNTGLGFMSYLFLRKDSY